MSSDKDPKHVDTQEHKLHNYYSLWRALKNKNWKKIGTIKQSEQYFLLVIGSFLGVKKIHFHPQSFPF